MKHLAALAAAASLALTAATRLDIPNLDFEQQFANWSNHNTFTTVEKDAAHTGSYGIHVTDTSEKDGANLFGPRFPLKTGTGYKITFWGRRHSPESGGTSVYVRFFNAKGRQIADLGGGEIVHSMTEKTTWEQSTFYFIPQNKDIVQGCIWIHSPNAAHSDDYLDDLEIFELTPEETKNIPMISRAGFPAPSAARVAEIEAMLDDAPRGVGYPVYDRNHWDHIANLNGYDSLLKSAEKLLKEPIPELKDEEYLLFTQTGDRRTYERPYFLRKTRLYTLAVVEGIDNKGRFLPALEDIIDAILHEKSWTLPAHDASLTNFKQTKFTVDLFASERASDLATVDWLFQDRLKPETRAAIRREIQRKVLGPYLHTIRTGIMSAHGWMRGNGNWNAVCTGNCVNCILTIVEDKHTRAEVLAATEYSDDRFLSGFTPDGYCTEGVGYWGYGFGHYLMMGEHILQATHGKMNIFDKPGIEAVAAFGTNIQIEDGICPAFADCSVSARPDDKLAVLIQRHWPQALNKRAVPNSVVQNYFPLMPLIAFSDESAFLKDLPEKAVYPLRSAFADAGIYLFRETDKDGNIFGAAIKGGHNAEHHNHNDVGSFIVTYKRKRFIEDPGSETYTRQTFSHLRYTFNLLNSFGHPVPVVAGKLQFPGRRAAGKFIRTDFTDDCDTAVLDLSQAYNVPELKALTRTFVFNRKTRTITLSDHVEYTSPQDFSTALVSRYPIAILSPERQLLYDADDCLDVTVTAEGGTWTVKQEKIIRQFNKLGPNRLSFTMAAPVTEATITMTMTPKATPIDLVTSYKAPKLNPKAFAADDTITIQAEAFTDQQGDKTVVAEAKPEADGTAIKLWDSKGQSLTWAFDAPRDGDYYLQLKACTAAVDGAARTVKLDGKAIPGSYLFPFSGGWSSTVSNWKVLFPADNGKPVILHLTKGPHTLELTNDDGNGLNVDWLKLFRLLTK